MQNILSLIRGFLGEIGGRLAPESVTEEERFHLPPAEPRMASGKFFEIPKNPSRPLAFHLFQTGKSRTFMIGKLSTDNDVRPVHYASVASVVLSRHEGKLAPYTRPLTADIILLDMNGINEEEVVERYSEGIEIIDTQPSDSSYTARRIAAITKAVGIEHEMMEEGLLALREGREQGVLVMIDGSLAKIEGASMAPGVVGLVPANPDVLGKGSSILECPLGARSALDNVGHPPAFYMRLRDATNKNPDFALVRVELGLKPDSTPPDEAYASDIACLLLNERFPVDMGIPGWDKSIFALHFAGVYLDTLIPPPGVVTTYFGRSAS